MYLYGQLRGTDTDWYTDISIGCDLWTAAFFLHPYRGQPVNNLDRVPTTDNISNMAARAGLSLAP